MATNLHRAERELKKAREDMSGVLARFEDWLQGHSVMHVRARWAFWYVGCVREDFDEWKLPDFYPPGYKRFLCAVLGVPVPPHIPAEQVQELAEEARRFMDSLKGLPKGIREEGASLKTAAKRLEDAVVVYQRAIAEGRRP